MNELSAKERIQTQINFWIKTIQKLNNELDILEVNSPDYQQVLRALREYKGRVLAARFIDGILGFELDTDYNRIS